MEYPEIIETITELTDPERTASQKISLWASGDTILPLIATAREAAYHLSAALDAAEGDGHQVPKTLKEEMGNTVRKMHKNCTNLIQDFARFHDHMQTCRCASCQAQRAPLN